MPGFDEGGGMAGTFAWAKNPRADLKLAAEYMKKAGYASGKYSGPKLSMVGLNEPPSSTTSQAVLHQLEKLGFQFDYRQVDFNTLIGSTCGSSEAHIAVCPNGAWTKDFFDPQSMIDPVFNGKNIGPEQSPNWSQVNDPELNAQLDMAVSVTDEAERAKVYGELDRQVTSQAYVITWIWDDQINIRSEDVNGVASKFTAAWDLTYTSVK
jgi:peptide/nickel transport system substrate-binding protein